MLNSLYQQRIIKVAQANDISSARFASRSFGLAIGLNERNVARLEDLVYQASRTILANFSSGSIHLSRLGGRDVLGVQMLVLDKGHGSGLHNQLAVGDDGGSSNGNLSRMKSMQVNSDEYEVYAPRGLGTAILVRIWQGAPPTLPWEIGTVCVPLDGYDENGDAWAVNFDNDELTLMICDGLGHGAIAAIASKAALDAFAIHSSLSPAAQIAAYHHDLHDTCGAVIAITQVNLRSREAKFVGIGNASVLIVDNLRTTHMISHNGVVGHSLRKMQEFSFELPSNSLLIMHSDGVKSRWDFSEYPGLVDMDVSIIAGVLSRDFARGSDDICIAVLRT